jgi:hypothetical protein
MNRIQFIHKSMMAATTLGVGSQIPTQGFQHSKPVSPITHKSDSSVEARRRFTIKSS